MPELQGDRDLSMLADQYLNRAVTLDPQVSIAAIIAAFSQQLDDVALSGISMKGYWEAMANKGPLSYDSLVYHPDNKLLYVDEKRAKLAPTPLKIMTYLMFRKEDTVGYPDLMRLIGALDQVKGRNQIRTNIQRIRDGIFDQEYPDGIWGLVQTIPDVGVQLISRRRLYELAEQGKLPYITRLEISRSKIM